MNAFELRGTAPDGKSASVWACGVCRLTNLGPDTATSCCAPERCLACGDEVPPQKGRWDAGRFYCGPCFQLEREHREAERLEKAERVDEVTTPRLFCGCCDQFYSDSGELLDDHERHQRALPAYAWACDEVKFALGAERTIEGGISDLEFSDETEFDADAVQELQVTLDAWCSKYPTHNYFANGKIVELAGAIEKFRAELRAVGEA